MARKNGRKGSELGDDFKQRELNKLMDEIHSLQKHRKVGCSGKK